MSDLLDRLQPALAEHYAIERELGRGGMASVYLAKDLKHNRAAAMKVLRPELAAALGSERFLREVQITCLPVSARRCGKTQFMVPTRKHKTGVPHGDPRF